MITFRLSEPEDFEPVNALARQAHMLHLSWRPDLFRSVAYPFEQQVFSERTQKQQILLACKGKEIAAYAAYSVSKTDLPMLCPRTVLTVDNLCVDEKYRQKGIAKKLMRHLSSLAKSWGCSDMQLICYPENIAGIALYESLGMRVKAVQYQKKL